MTDLSISERSSKQSALRRFVTTPIACKGCGAVRRALGKVVGIKTPAS